ncbi:MULTISPECIES: REP-associated tyrosine transposase [Xanthomonas]|uniref:Transposase n=1 Tax=Xanthomonas cucurbitae TaxID=56453 RepID=A0A2S7DKF6_9XANT|nr:transposase [Xanthomonas cucurbitae]PPU74291.1 transposase [Xanthomonas cucurbitae]QHG86379.1 transposase [Xanthomonas cucurbitae]WDM68631.1 transposase [Xanthomonas cucurbitae]WDM72505.1 transposase [Xanthomonas cucurbitae]WDM76296.1 transposase [Xanthomonas cucurbitae]
MVNARSPGHRALRRGRHGTPNACYLLTTTTWQRRTVFADFQLAATACRAFTAAIPPDARLLAWVLMPDHAHWLLQLGHVAGLADVVSRMKACSARAVNAQRRSGAPVWSRSYHDHAVRKDDDLPAAARYVVANPLRAGLVTRVGDYPFWNAIWL